MMNNKNELIKDLFYFHGIEAENEVYLVERNKKMLKVDVEKVNSDVETPVYQTTGSAGCDVKAYLPDADLTIYPGETKLIPTGLKFSVPEGYEMQIRPRSGLSLKTKLRIANTPGTLDSDYRGELMIIIENTANPLPAIDMSVPGRITIKNGERIAQLVFAPVVQAEFEIKDSLDGTERGSGGFGSTGTN